MNTIKILLVMSLATCCLSACEDTLKGYELSEKNQEVYFQYEFVNEAWGHQHHGWIIDSAGQVHCYENPESWNSPDSLGILSAGELKANLNATDFVCYELSKEELSEKVSQISKSATGQLSDPENEMYDAGIHTFSAYIYNKESMTYKRIILRQEGDFRVENSAGAADDLYDWLSFLKNEISHID